MQICYDIEFPEASRYLADQGVEILFVPYCTDDRHGQLRVRYCAQARAIENQIFVATAGVIGNLPSVPAMDIHYGQAAVFTPSDFAFARDGIQAIADSNVETLLVTDLDTGDLYRSRAAGSVTPRLDRRTDLFELKVKLKNSDVSGVPIDEPESRCRSDGGAASHVESEVAFRVSETHVADESGEGGEIVGQFAAVGLGADQIAEDAAEIFVARERQERAGIREHADEAREQAGGGERVELEFHAVLLVEEPPAGAELDLAGDRAVLEGTGQAGEEVIVTRVEIVEHDLRQRVPRASASRYVDERGPCGCRRWSRSRCPGRVSRHARVDVPERAEMKLLGPAARGIELAEEHHQVERELFLLLGGGGLAGRALSKISAASSSEQGRAGRRSSPWSDRRPPAAWKSSWRFCRAASRSERWRYRYRRWLRVSPATG